MRETPSLVNGHPQTVHAIGKWVCVTEDARVCNQDDARRESTLRDPPFLPRLWQSEQVNLVSPSSLRELRLIRMHHTIRDARALDVLARQRLDCSF